MEYELKKAIEILQNTPTVLHGLLENISEEWIRNNEGEATWSPYDVIGHLIHGEKTDWIPRLRIILKDSSNKTFLPFDRFAQRSNDQEISIHGLLQKFSTLRQSNIEELLSYNLDTELLNKKGIHPEFGEVTARQLLATWVVHDLGHITQIARVMAKQYKDEVGPWNAYLKILQDE